MLIKRGDAEIVGVISPNDEVLDEEALEAVKAAKLKIEQLKNKNGNNLEFSVELENKNESN